MKIRSFCLILLFVLSACNLGTSDVTPIPTPDIPIVEILAPENNQQVFEDTDFDFDIVARDSTSGIALVELYVDEIVINFSSPIEDASVPVFRTTMNWRAVGVGRHIVEVIAYRADGQQSDPARITIEVLARDE
ncbi:MAG: hypothetical protein Phog2KO_39430 [Phototrophicaceae bacterium]